MRFASVGAWIALVFLASCMETRGSAWVKGGGDDRLGPGTAPVAAATEARGPVQRDMRTRTIGSPEPPERAEGEEEPPRAAAPPRGTPLGTFRNTYYSFPVATDFSGAEVALFDAACREIARVPEAFHDTLCVQGSGRLASQQTVSFAKRDCSCARVCPRSQQRICYEALDPVKFPWGRGAAGRAIHPLRSLAVDTSVIALGTNVYAPAYVGMPLPGGGVHDGCFRAEDRGLKIVGKQVDVFAGAEGTLREWNKRVPTGAGVDLYADPSCAGR